MTWYLFSSTIFAICYHVNAATNLALGKQATSSTFSGKDASFAVDGNSASLWNEGSCFQTDSNDMQPWWQVDLENYYRVTHIIVTARSDVGFDDRLHDFSVEVYMNDPPPPPPPPPPPHPNQDPPPPSPVSQPCLYYPGNLPAVGPVPLNCSTQRKGRFVVLRGNATRHSDDRFTICEVEVFGHLESISCNTCIKYVSTTGTRRNADAIGTPSFADTPGRCARECQRDFRCKSFNFNQGGSPSCEIILEGPANHVSDQNWIYYRRRPC